MNIPVVQRILGLLLTLFSVTMLPPILVALVFADGAWPAFAWSFLIVLAVGGLIWWPVRKAQKDLRLRDGLYDEDPEDGIDNDGDCPGDTNGDGIPCGPGDEGVDEDGPDDDEDGLVDEDGACEDAVIFCFEYEFDVTDLGLNPGDLMRINLMVTFDSGGRRGGICSVDVDCDGDRDLLVGDFPGYFWFFENTKSDKAPKYRSRGKLKAGDEAAKTPVY